MTNSSARYIELQHVAQNNLKGFDLRIPAQAITVITGRSGSGKSTLAVDVLHAHAQLTYMESVGMTLEKNPPKRPNVRCIRGIMPSLCIESQSSALFYGATVASLCDIDYFLRLLFAQIGVLFCPSCNQEVISYSPDQIVKKLCSMKEGSRLTVLAPVSPSSFDTIKRLQADGFTRVRVNNDEICLIEDALGLSAEPSMLDAVIDRVVVRHGILSRLSDSIRLCLRTSGSVVKVLAQEPGVGAIELSFSLKRHCAQCDMDFEEPQPSFFSPFSERGRCPVCKGRRLDCASCNGSGLNTIAGSYRFGGKNIAEIMQLSIDEFDAFLRGCSSCKHAGSGVEEGIFDGIADAIFRRLAPVIDMGLGYLALGRRSTTISGGELQRLRLGAQLGRDMQGILYILDEPTCGLHPVEQQALWQHLEGLKARGNTIVVIEHDPYFIRHADFVVELGPGSGKNGGELIFVGKATEVLSQQQGNQNTGVVRQKKKDAQDFLVASGLNANNLKSVAIKLPLNRLVCITGVSGSGKTTLAKTCLYQAIAASVYDRWNISLPVRLASEGLSVRYLDQKPFATSKYSMPATYMGIFNQIRLLFSQTKQARALGLVAGYFSLSRKGGRCEACEGIGTMKKVMDIMPSMEFVCDICDGRRYNQDCLEIKYKGLNLFEVLELTVEEALQVFARHPQIAQPLRALERVGLSYLKIGQNARTLSGGESQRIRLAQAFSRERPEHTLYFLDEPSRGLHISDVVNLLHLIDELLDNGHSVVVIEHNRMFLENADWILELGPEGGEKGGYLIAEGTPENLAGYDTPTGRFLHQSNSK